MMNNAQPLLAIAAMLVVTSGSPGFCQQRGVKESEPTTGDITGKVVNEHGQPLANARVYVRPIGSSTQPHTTNTDREGKFKVTGLERAAYRVLASLPAYISATSATWDSDYDPANYFRIGDSVRLELIKGGVITGTVTTSTGAPVVGIAVRALMIRDSNDRASRSNLEVRERTTDDRGVYRIYGLTSGTYIVFAGSNIYSSYAVNAYGEDTPTFALSANRDTAGEFVVRAGEETSNVDIRHRGETGHVVSGIASGGSTGTPGEYTILLSSVFNGKSQPVNFFYQSPGSTGFAFYGVADGDYYLSAQLMAFTGLEGVSEHRRIKVRGADVTGIELVTKPLGSISGQVILEESNAPECKDKRRPVFAETLITPLHNEATDRPRFRWSLGSQTLPDQQGSFTMRNLLPGQYRFDVRMFAKYWYLKSIALPSPASKKSPLDVTLDAMRNWTTLQSGQRVSGLSITLASGAASLQGSIKLVKGRPQTPRQVVYLIPAEKERIADLAHYFASPVNLDGTFSLSHLPPGRYLTMSRVSNDPESSVLSRLRSLDKVDFRAKLRQEATSETEVELKPCQNLAGFQLTLQAQQIVEPK
jgi:hypothetical protein